jgi:hypothetical protein
MFLFSLVEGMFLSSMVYNSWAMMLLVSLYPGCRFLKNSWLTGPSLHSVPNSKSQNLASISVHFYLWLFILGFLDKLFGLCNCSWCVAVCLYHMIWIKVKLSSIFSPLTTFLQQERMLKNIHMLPLYSTYTERKWMKGHILFLRPWIFVL